MSSVDIFYDIAFTINEGRTESKHTRWVKKKREKRIYKRNLRDTCQYFST